MVCDYEIFNRKSRTKKSATRLLELGQITCEENTGGKLVVDKYGNGASPNLADAFMMATAPRQKAMAISSDLLARLDKINPHQ